MLLESSVSLHLCQVRHVVLQDSLEYEILTDPQFQAISAVPHHWCPSAQAPGAKQQTCGQRILMKGSIACRTFSEDWLISSAAHSVAETLNAFEWAIQPPIIATFRGGSWSASNTRFLGPTLVSPQTTSRLVLLLLQGSWKWPTQQTSSVATDHF